MITVLQVVLKQFRKQSHGEIDILKQVSVSNEDGAVINFCLLYIHHPADAETLRTRISVVKVGQCQRSEVLRDRFPSPD